MRVRLTYTKTNGEVEEVKFDDNVTSIDLSIHSIESIDLSPLKSCTSLQELDLSNNTLNCINFSPLKSCTSFKHLFLMENPNEETDFTPLKSCTNLEILGLDRNLFEHIDLSFLKPCTKLRALSLKGCIHLTTIDLNPLSNCTNLQRLSLVDTAIQDIDTTPLFSNPEIGTTRDDLSRETNWELHSWIWRKSSIYRRPKLRYRTQYIREWATRSYPWSFLYKVAEQEGDDIRVQQDVLLALGLGKYGFIDFDMREMFLSIPPDSTIEFVRKRVISSLVEMISSIIDSGGTTIGLQVKQLSDQHAEIASRFADIAELRKKEMQDIRLGTNEGRVDLRELWLSSYGYELLSVDDFWYTI